ncbi:hypothetical protein O4H61_14415 [Roseovarius aestuarii]|nr:hypothetical protein [Roseovarius aestuarii]
MPFAHETTSLRGHEYELRPGLRLNPLQSASAQVSEAETDKIIAQTLAQNRKVEARAAMPDIADQDELLGLAGRNARRDARRQEAAAARLNTVAQSAAVSGPTRQVEDLTGGATRFRMPNVPGVNSRSLRRVVLITGLAAFVYVWPWVIPLTLFVAFWTVLIALAALGSDRIGERVLQMFLWLNARNPDRAERLRQRADGLAMRVDALLDRLPERWTEGLYMPDLSRAALIPQDMDDRPDPFDRIAAESQSA